MGMEIEKVKNASEVLSERRTLNEAESKGVGVINFSFGSVGNVEYNTNTASNVFLKEYFEGKALSQGIKIPNGMSIQISTPKEFSDEFKELLKYVSKEIYKSRVNDLFRLLTQDKEKFSEKLLKMKISDADKNKIIMLKNYFDNYYKAEIKHNTKTINLLNLTKQDIEYLRKISPEFAQFVQKEQKELKKHSVYFAQKEISKLRLDDAGHNSAVAAGGLATILSFLVGKSVWESREIAGMLKNNRASFLRAQADILKAGIPKIRNPFRQFIEAAKNGLTKSRAKNPAGLVLGALLATTLSGSADDLMGCVKDSIQDVDNFGWAKGMAINIPAAFCGIITSAAIAPMIEGQISYNRAEKYLKKFSGELKPLGINPAVLENKGILKNIMKKGGKTALLAGGLLLVGNAVKGIITAMSSSGSSWGSMAGTRIVMDMAGNELEKKGIISKEENTFKNTTDNMMAYEAYKGKWTGIAQQDPLIGATGGVLGLFTHANPYVQSLSFGLQGCSETLTACYYQVTGAKDRKDDLLNEKIALVQAVAN